MSKIALISSNLEPVTQWRTQTGIDENLAPWVYVLSDIERFGPFSSVLCLPNWGVRPQNHQLRERIIVQITAARLGESETLTVDELDHVATAPIERVRPAATFPSTPVLTENERVLREFGVNPALIGMLEDETQNSLVAAIRRSPPSLTRSAIEQLARRRGIPAWAVADNVPSRAEALEIVRHFYGTNAHFQTMNDSRLFACRDLARRGQSARGFATMEDVVRECREGIQRMLVEQAEEEISRAAGFLDAESGPPAERTPGDDFEPPAYRPQPRAYSDPLRDHLRSFMREERETPRRRINPRRID